MQTVVSCALIVLRPCLRQFVGGLPSMEPIGCAPDVADVFAELSVIFFFKKKKKERELPFGIEQLRNFTDISPTCAGPG